MLKLPKISVITPAYNREDLLEETVLSILNQKYPKLEYIIIDDGSKDGTYQIAKKYSKKAKVIRQKNIGETNTVNKALRLVKGDIVGIVNSDDPLLPNSLRAIADYFVKHPKVLAVYPNWVMIDKFGNTLQNVYPEKYNYEKMIKEHYCIPGPGTFFRKKAIKLTGGRDKKFKYIADFAFWLKLGMYGELAHIPKTLASFRSHPESQGIYAKSKKMAEEHLVLMDWLFGDKDLPSKIQLIKRQAYASAYFHGARESTNISQKLDYYTKAFLLSPLTVTGKLKYELVKLKKKITKIKI